MPSLLANDLNLFESSTNTSNLIPINSYINDFTKLTSASIITSSQYESFFATASTFNYTHIQYPFL